MLRVRIYTMLQNHPSHPSSPNTTTKWVTFNDMVDDAMEGGKLRNNKNNYNLNRRRASMMETPAPSGLFFIPSFLNCGKTHKMESENHLKSDFLKQQSFSFI